MNIEERKKNLEVLLQQKTLQIQAMETEKNKTLTEIVKIQGKLDLLQELALEQEKKIEKKEIDNKTK